jgi:hypothetical protein
VIVEERLIDAWQLLARMPDRERAWLASGTMSLWRMVTRDLVEGSGDDAPVERSGLTTREVDRMNEALGWLDHVAEQDRKLIGLAIGQLARGSARVSWRVILRDMGLKHGRDGLRKRYGRALQQICARLNSADFRAASVSSGKIVSE